jgi:hypothetical protein
MAEQGEPASAVRDQCEKLLAIHKVRRACRVRVMGARSRKVATVEQMAALDFEPWPRPDWIPPTNEEWAELANPYLVTIRIAWQTVQRTKPDLVKMMAALDEDVGRGLMESFVDTLSFFEGVVGLLKCAEARILAAGAAGIVSSAEHS